MERPPIWMTITMLGGLLMIFIGEMYYTFIGPHPDASGSINENVLDPLFWADHPGISTIMLGGILVIVTYVSLSRFDRRAETSGRTQNAVAQTTLWPWFIKIKTRLSRGGSPPV